MPDEHADRLDAERQLAQRLRAGDATAWHTLYDAYAERVWRTVARMLGPASADVADVVQETMLAAARTARSFDPERGSLWHWLAGIARNHVALHYRKRQQQRRLVEAAVRLTASNGQLAGWLHDTHASPPEALAAAEMAVLVRATLAELPADHGDVLAARYLDGETVAEIAVREQSSEVAIRSRLARARHAFRHAFSRFAPDVSDRPTEAHHESP